MNIGAIAARADAAAAVQAQTRAPQAPAFDPRDEGQADLKVKFTEFVAGSFFKAMLEAMRKTVANKSLMHGGRAEEVFRSQLDNTLASRMAIHGGGGFSEKLYRQFLLEQGAKRGIDDEESPPKRTDSPGSGAEPGRITDHTW